MHYFFAAVVATYPAVVYFGTEVFDARFIALCLIAVTATRLLLAGRQGGLSAYKSRFNIIFGVLLVVGVMAALANSTQALQYYPVCVNWALLAVFAASLVRPPSIVEQIARLRTPDLPEAAVSYTRKVTMVWCAFFVVNGSIALYTVIAADIGMWAVYNSFVSYVLMGLLFAGEYIVRRTVAGY